MKKWIFIYSRSDTDSTSTNQTSTCWWDLPIVPLMPEAGLTMFLKWQSYHKLSDLCSGASTSCMALSCNLSMPLGILIMWSPMTQVWFEDYFYCLVILFKDYFCSPSLHFLFIKSMFIHPPAQICQLFILILLLFSQYTFRWWFRKNPF